MIPPPLRCERASLRIPLMCCVLSGVLASYFFSVLLFLPFFDLNFGRRLCHPSFHVSVLYPVSSVSVSVATRFAYDVYPIHTYAEVIFSFFSEVRVRIYTICFSHGVFSSVSTSICFPPEVTLRARWLLPIPWPPLSVFRLHKHFFFDSFKNGTVRFLTNERLTAFRC